MTATIINPTAHTQLVAMGYHGPKGNDPEIVNIDGQLTAFLKKANFTLRAALSEEFGHSYTVFDLTYYHPKQNLNPRPNYAGPVAALDIRTILEQDIPQLPQFEAKLIRAGAAFEPTGDVHPV